MLLNYHGILIKIYWPKELEVKIKTLKQPNIYMSIYGEKLSVGYVMQQKYAPLKSTYLAVWVTVRQDSASGRRNAAYRGSVGL